MRKSKGNQARIRHPEALSTAEIVEELTVLFPLFIVNLSLWGRIGIV